MGVEQAPPTIFLLCGFVGSGKTTYAMDLESRGVIRLSIDEWVFERHGRHGVDYPEDQYPEFEREAVAFLDDRMESLVRQGSSVVLDYGLWSRQDRVRYKRLAAELGARWTLLYFEASDDLLRERLRQRNTQDDANALTVADRHFEEFATRFHPPKGEGEVVVPQT